jgi:alpha-beta hydrolase superfamily lysophospholipase
LSPFQKLLVKVLPGLVPDLRVGNGLNRNYISHDKAVITAYKADPLVHDRVSARLGKFFATAGPETEAAASQWEVPTLLMYSGDDRILNWQGSKRFGANAPKDVVKTVCFADMYHELFNEKHPAVVYRTLEKWLDSKYPAKETQTA